MPDIAYPEGLLEEHRFTHIAFHEGGIIPTAGKDNTGEPSSASHVEDAVGRRDMFRELEGIEDMPFPYFLPCCAFGNEINMGIPFLEMGNIGFQSVKCFT